MTSIQKSGKAPKPTKRPTQTKGIERLSRDTGAVAVKVGAKGQKPQFKPLTIFGRMGRLLGEHIESDIDVVRIVNLGLPSSALNRLVKEINVNVVRLIGPETTVRRRMLGKQPFTIVESERLVRLARVTSMAEELFGDTKAASSWLATRSNYLPGAEPISPLELSATDSGARMVESMMLRTAHGIF